MSTSKQLGFSFKNHVTKIGLVVALSINATAGFAANECRVKYQHKRNNGTAYAPKYLYINSGQTKNVNARHLDYVKNLKNRDVKIWVGNYNKVLKKNNVDPLVGYHLADVTFKKVKCLASNQATPIDVIIQQMKNAGKSANQIAVHLKNTLNQSASQAVTLLKQIGFTSQQVLANALKSAGYTLNQITSALKSAGKFTANQISQALKAAGYSINQIVSTLKSAGKFTANQIAKALKAAGYTLNQIVTVMKVVGKFSLNAMTIALKAAGYGTDQLAKSFFAAGKYTLNQVAKALKDANYSVSQIVSALKAAGNYTAKQMAKALKYAGYNIANITRHLKNVAKFTVNEIAAALKAAGYSAEQIAKALHDEFKMSAQKVEQILKQIGYSAAQAADAVKSFAGSVGKAIERFNIVEEFCGFKTNQTGTKSVTFNVYNFVTVKKVGVSIAGRNLGDVKVIGLPKGLTTKYSAITPAKLSTTKPEMLGGFSIATVTPERKYAYVKLLRQGNKIINTQQRSGTAYAVDKFNKRIKGAYCDWTIKVEPMPLADPNLPARLNAPTFISPDNEVVRYNNSSNLKSPALKWNASRNATGYTLSYKTNASGARESHKVINSRASTLCDIVTGLNTGSYKWRVRAMYKPAERYDASHTVYSDYTTYRTFRLVQDSDGNVSPTPSCR